MRLAVIFVVVAHVVPSACVPAATTGEGEGEGDGEGEGEGEGELVDEVEPNGGDPVTDVNAIAVGGGARGAIGAAGDADVFALPTTPGHVYRARCATSGSPLDCHLTVLDDGRGGDAAGADYVRLASVPAGNDAELTFMALGDGGHFVIVRDARDVAGDGAGGADFTYALTIVDITDETGLRGAALTFPATTAGALPSSSSLQLHAIDANEGADVVIDVTADGDADLRAFVVSVASGDWVMRNDDDGADPDPRIDAFFPEGGAMLLLIEAVSDDATGLGYTLTTTGNAP